jgi:hypothetical protein
MPFNLTSPNSAEFTVDFVDAFGNSYTPSSANITFVYLINNVSNSSALDLSLSAGHWILTWSSVGVDVPSNVTWTVVSSCSPNPAQIGTIRIIDP